MAGDHVDTVRGDRAAQGRDDVRDAGGCGDAVRGLLDVRLEFGRHPATGGLRVRLHLGQDPVAGRAYAALGVVLGGEGVPGAEGGEFADGRLDAVGVDLP
jgi:hypothetical protein